MLTKYEEFEEYDKQVDYCKQRTVETFLLLGSILGMIKERELFTQSGNHIKSFADYLKEKDLAKSTALHAINAWRIFEKQKDFIIENNIREGQLIDAIPLLREAKEEDKNALLEKASVLHGQEWKDEIAEMKGETPTDMCNHERVANIVRCIKCHKTLKYEEKENTETDSS